MAVNGEVSYFMGRFNLLAQYNDSKRAYILKSLKKHQLVKRRDFEWGFLGVEELTYAEQDFVYGYLVKVRPTLDEEVIDRDKHASSYESLSNAIVAKCDFFLHYRSGVMAYRPISNQVSAQLFRDRFSDVFMEANERIFCDAEIQTIQEDLEIFEAIKRFKTIRKLEVVLHPSNPSSRYLYRKKDGQLKSMDVEKYTETYESKRKEGIIIPDDSEAYANIVMATDGYGVAKIHGELDNETKVASTADTPIKMVAATCKDPYNAMDRLISSFRQVWGRIKDEP